MPPLPGPVAIADPIDAEAIARLRGAGVEVSDATASPEALDAALATAWALVVRSRTKVTARLLARAPRLRLIARAGVGVDNVDLAAAAARSVTVVNAPTAATVSVAELTVALALMLVRELYPSIEATRAGRWTKGTRGGELAGRTVGLVGYGRIAREVAARLRPFGVTLLAHDPFVRSTDDGTRLVPLPELLASSDIVSLHAAATDANRHLLDADAFARMRPGAFLINVARGTLVDPAALKAALASGRLGGAALDVFDTEPPMDSELVQHPRVIPTPHIGASTHEAQRRAGALVADEVLRAWRGEPVRFSVPLPAPSPATEARP
ncbi:MAG: hydroxyacid dehydrogenase [Thermoplasmata archaeon]